MKDYDILLALVASGAKVHNVEEKRAVALLDRVIGGDTLNKDQYRELFYRLVKKLGQSESVKYTPKRATKLKRRLKTFTEAELLQAADIIAQDEFLMGDNPGAKRYGNIDYLLRDDEIVDQKIADTTITGHTDLRTIEF